MPPTERIQGGRWPENLSASLFSRYRIAVSLSFLVRFFITILSMSSSSEGFAQPRRFLDEWRWVEFTTESGLPSNHVYAILETQSGTPWAFTKSGMTWYDGHMWNPVLFPETPPFAKPLSFYSDSRGKIIVTLDSTVFVGDTSGFNKLNVSHVVHAAPLQDGRLLLLREDPDLHQWLDIWDGQVLVPAPMPEGVELGHAMNLKLTQSGIIWLSASDCLFVWREEKWQRRFHAHSEQFPLVCDLVENESNSGLVSVFSPYASRGVWEWEKGKEFVRSQASENVQGADIATDGTVLLAIDAENYRVRHDGEWTTLQLQRLSATQIEMIKFRKSGDLWLCTDRGLFLIKYASELWRFISESAPSPHNSINDILLASDSSLWLATGGGLHVYKKDETTTRIEEILGRKIFLATGLLEDRRGDIWVCSGSGFTGALKWDGSKWGKVGVGTPLEHAQIHRMKMDRNGKVWLLGIPSVMAPPPNDEGPGAFVYENGVITRWGVREGLLSNRVYAFEEGTDSSLWFGTMAGLSKWKAGTWKHWTTRELFSADRVFTLAIDKDGQVWFSNRKDIVGTVSSNGSVRRIRTEDGLMSEVVSEIKVDSKGRVWCTTPIGLAAYYNGSWTSFDVTSGIRNAPFWPVLPLENTVYAGSNSGLSVLSLKDIDQSAPKVYLTQPNTIGRAAMLKWRAVTRWGDISPVRIETRYRVGRLPWSEWSHSREANIQNLLPGEYVYEVQSKPLFGGDSTTYATARSSFFISLPMSQDPRFIIPAAIVIFVLLAVGIGVTTYTRRQKQIQLREELRREHEHAERLAEVDKIKSRFFANISHEFRTPLTLVLGPVGQALSRINDEWVREKLVMAHRNAQKLHVLINQLLDYSKIEAGSMKLSVRKGDILSFLHRIVQSFQSWAAQKNLELNFETDDVIIEGYFDTDNVEKILNNLISNALKFTHEGGKVCVKVERERGESGDGEKGRIGDQGSLTLFPTLPFAHSVTNKGVVRITVKDTGIGIAPEHLPHIFDRFYRVDESHRTEGTGIGLALAKELVELHHGSITVQSMQEKGTEFTVTLPLARASFTDQEIVETRSGEMDERTGETGTRTSILPDSVGEEVRPAESEEGDLDQRPIILIVEDSADVRAYIRGYLVAEYSVLEAQDGAAALESAFATIPDLVVSDVMMPLMNGYELCKELKQDERTSHIPVILLTARSGMENKIAGLELGADDYLTKPFDAKELLTRIRNLIEGRRKLREKFSKTVPLKPGEVAVTSLDDTFLRKAMDVVEKCMGDEEFSVEQFSEQMALSRMQLYRKLHALTNQSTGEFIRHMRLLRAHELLMRNVGTISEIAFQTGFGSLTYFTRCYHEQFGRTPSETRERAVKHS